MTETLLIVDDLKDWEPYYPSENVMTFEHYLAHHPADGKQRTRVINLCRSYRYLSDGYYCSLLAEARGHNVIPSVRVLSDLSRRSLYRLLLDDMTETLDRALKTRDPGETVTIRTYFGNAPAEAFEDLARMLFERFACPVLEITLRRDSEWEIVKLKAISPRDLDDAEQTAFAESLDEFSREIWRRERSRKQFRFDMAILVNSEEKMPPSNAAALKKFIAAGKRLDIDVEIISPRDYMSLPEYDALFIRETTSIDHHTYRFAKKAETEGLVVVDDPTSILRCTNKIYLADLFQTHKVPAPRTWFLHKGRREQLDRAEQEAGYPLVLKIPDGSFSRGIVKVKDREEMEKHAAELFQNSALLLAQEFLYTDFDWRIGIFNNKPLYACRYYMVKNHWQIYRHGGTRTASGDFDTMPTFEVPKPVLDAAMRATRPIGDGFYGVDVKEKDGKGYVIEVNDNPNIDAGIEDRYLGDSLYDLIMEEFLRRMEMRVEGRKG